MRCAHANRCVPLQPLSRLWLVRRLSELSLDVQNAPRVSKDHTERALQYMEFKARAEQTLLAEMDVVKSVRALCALAFASALTWAARAA